MTIQFLPGYVAFSPSSVDSSSEEEKLSMSSSDDEEDARVIRRRVASPPRGVRRRLVRLLAGLGDEMCPNVRVAALVADLRRLASSDSKSPLSSDASTSSSDEDELSTSTCEARVEAALVVRSPPRGAARRPVLPLAAAVAEGPAPPVT